MKKKKNAFTLIELLAIIVILAIIAVITVPIILNIIENSRKGAAQDSVYGYKDSINKYYLGKLSENQNYNDLDGEYTIDSNGYLVESGTVKHQIQTSGQKPSGGTITIENKIITTACVQVGDYKVSISNGIVGQAEKGSCPLNEQAQITVADYGKYVNIGTNLLGKNNTTEADWRVFYKDTNGVWLILADYLPVGEGTIGASVVSTVGLEIDNNYNVCSDVSREDLMSRLNGNWNGLVSESDIIGETGVIVKGATDLPTWIASWNQNTGYTHLYYAYTVGNGTGFGNGTGYGISVTETNIVGNHVDLSENIGYNDSLYYPHKDTFNDENYCEGYLLASPSLNYNSNDPIAVSAWGSIGSIDGYNAGTHGVRPVVYLPNAISFDKTETVWTITQ